MENFINIYCRDISSDIFPIDKDETILDNNPDELGIFTPNINNINPKVINIPTNPQQAQINLSLAKTTIFTCTKVKKKLGRKKKFSNEGFHNKYCDDNLTRKLKTNLFRAILRYINSYFTLYSKNIFNCKNKRYFLCNIVQEIIVDIKVNNNLKLLNSKLKDIFSNNIGKKYSTFEPNHNKNLIQKIYDEAHPERIQAILEKTFFECLEQYRGTKKYEELTGLEEYYTKLINKFKKEGENVFIDAFENFVNNFELIYKNKKPQKE